jgi:hypothetical protein
MDNKKTRSLHFAFFYAFYLDLTKTPKDHVPSQISIV